MLTVFKKYLGYLIAGEIAILAFAAALIHDGTKWYWIVGAVALLSLMLLAVLEVMAVSLHQRLLGLLYIWQQPKRFVEAYSPLLEQKNVRRNMRFTMTAYLSNGCAAMGDFKKALSLLDTVPELPARRKSAGEAILAGNRCSICLYIGDTDSARANYEKLTSLIERNGGDAEIAKQCDGQALLRIRLALAETKAVKADADYVRDALKKPGSALHKTELRLLLGQLYIQLGDTSFARAYLSDASKDGGESWAGKQAKALLKTID